MSSAVRWAKMLGAGAILCIGGPMLVNYVRPTDEELFNRFNPDLQKRNLETRAQRQKEFNDFVTQLKEYSKSDKPIWVVAKEAEEQQNRQRREAAAALAAKKATTENPAEKHDDAIG